MEKVFQSVEEVLTDEQFQAWYFGTDATKAAAWEQWMKQNPSQEQLVAQAVSCMQSIVIKEHEPTPAQVQAQHQRLMDTLPAEEAPVIQMKPARRQWWWTAAAAIVLLVAGTWLWNSLNNQSSVKTAYGQLAQKQLPDGSEVTLNANSSISYSSGWTEGKEREVWIKGEAFFKVKKTAAKTRFIVHTDQLDVVVTGTQFNVISRADRSSVMLTEGSVTIRTKDGKETHLVPGDFVEFSNSQLERKAVKQEAVLAWTERKIEFDNTSLAEVVQIIKEHYGQQLEIANEELAARRITGIMPNNNLDVFLETLEATIECKVIRKDGRIIVTNP